MKSTPTNLPRPSLLHPFRDGLTANTLLLAVVVFLVALGNLSFFKLTLQAYPLAAGNALPLATLPLVLGATTTLLLGLICIGRLGKPVLIVILLLSALAAYYMDSFGVIFNDEMFQNMAQTNVAEASDLINAKMLAYLGLLGVLPAVLVARVPVRRRGWRSELAARLKLLAAALALLLAIPFSLGGFYASFIREHKAIRYHANPTYYVYSALLYLDSRWNNDSGAPLRQLGTDVRIAADRPNRELIIVVVGETARADRFSLNGYGRDTNPRLRQEKVISFDNFWACGTSTAVSVPCMFSFGGRESFSEKKALGQENVLDVIQRTGAYVLWLDNNSDSKGVATRVPYENFRTPDNNPICDDECRDEGMLVRVQDRINALPNGDIVIVLHQMGNHGPAYYKRYPKSFETFTPVCRSNDLSQCSDEEITNAYDNAILYTDYFLSKVIDLLKRNDSKFETVMFYLSDHGESLGEKGAYLHGLPYAFAPAAQLHVPAIMWFGNGHGPTLGDKRQQHYTHDHLSHTLLGLLGAQTSIYQPELDILQGSRRGGRH